MVITRAEIVPVRSSEDIVRVRQAVRNWAIDLGFGLVDQTKLVTAASELARNTVNYGGGGTVRMGVLNNAAHSGLQLIFEDNGPGIVDIELALQDGYTTGDGLGLGLGGARRLANEFEILSSPGEGTQVRIVRWT